MIRVKPELLTEAAEAVSRVMMSGTDSQGLRIMWHMDIRAIEKALCGMLASMTPSSGPDAVLPSDMGEFFMRADGTFQHVFEAVPAAEASAP